MGTNIICLKAIWYCGTTFGFDIKLMSKIPSWQHQSMQYRFMGLYVRITSVRITF